MEGWQGKANGGITLLSFRWSACSVTAFGGGAESCPTVKAGECLCFSLPLNVLTGAERRAINSRAAEGRAFNGVCSSGICYYALPYHIERKERTISY